MENLRFAPIIRVSTEKQEKKGESLTTQENQIKDYVKLLNGTIPDICWQYKGQESATPDKERLILEKLLKDSSKDIFDAVICCDASRWSRDNLKSKQGLKTLRENGIRFFVSMMEYDLFNPEHSFYLGISAEIGELHARQQSHKSITNRINKAKRGIPSSGALPYGRTFDRKTETWGIDPEKQKIIKQCAERYLNGESYKTIARTYNMDYTNLCAILTKHCGSEFTCRFRYENIDKTVIMKIPPLLDDKTISAIHKEADAKRTYKHGQIKNSYLLGRMIFCKNCGYTMSGFTSQSGRVYYRHARYEHLTCKIPKFVYALELENAVLIHLVTTLGDKDKVTNAIKQATPDLSKVEGLSKEKDELTKELKKITNQKENVVEMVSDGLLTKDEVKVKMEKIRLRDEAIHNRLLLINSELVNVPSQENIKRLTKLGIAVMADISRNPKSIFKKSYQWKRNLMEKAFSGTDSFGKRLGVYVDKTDNGWSFEIRGTLESTLLSLPLSDDYLIETFKLDSEYQDVSKELNAIRANISKMPQQ